MRYSDNPAGPSLGVGARTSEPMKCVASAPRSRAVLGELHEVLPQPLQLRLLPRVGPLVQRHLVLLGAFEQLLQIGFNRLYHDSP